MLNFHNFFQGNRYGEGACPLPDDGNKVKYQGRIVKENFEHINLHLAPDRWPHQHPTTQSFTGQMPFLPPNQQCQSAEGSIKNFLITKILIKVINFMCVNHFLAQLDTLST